MVKAELEALSAVFSNGRHNAFTDLIHWEGRYYCAFRTSDSHGPACPGNIMIMRTNSTMQSFPFVWEHCATIDTGGDDRDPKFFYRVGSKGYPQLGLIFGSYYPRISSWRYGKIFVNNELDFHSYVSLTFDGNAWTIPMQVHRPNYWLWSVENVPTDRKRRNGRPAKLIGAAYHFGNDSTDLNTIHLLETGIGTYWDTFYKFRIESNGDLSEPCLSYNNKRGVLGCCIRAGLQRAFMAIDKGSEDYDEWELIELDHALHAPAMVPYENGWLIAGRRSTSILLDYDIQDDKGLDPEYRTALFYFDLDDERTHHLLDVPSSGDNSYPGMVLSNDKKTLMMTYYSQHASSDLPYRKGLPHTADIYCAKIALQEE